MMLMVIGDDGSDQVEGRYVYGDGSDTCHRGVNGDGLW